jgi:hypothetical protein
MKQQLTQDFTAIHTCDYSALMSEEEFISSGKIKTGIYN